MIKINHTISLPAEIEATCVIAMLSSTGRDNSTILCTTNCVAFSIPFFIDIGLEPDATYQRYRLIIVNQS